MPEDVNDTLPDFSGDAVAVEDLPDFSAQAVSEKRQRLKAEQAEARKEIGPITEYFASGWGGPSPKMGAALASPLGMPLRPYRPIGPQPPIVQGVREFGKTIADLPVGMAQPEMLPLMPLAALPIPGGPAMRHVVPKAMGLFFGGQSLGHGAADIVTGIEQEDPRLIGRGGGEFVIGGGMAAPIVAGAAKPLLVPEPFSHSLKALREDIEVPSTVTELRTEVPPRMKPERLPRGQQVLAQEPLAGEFRVKEDSVRTEIESAEAKATAEIAEAWKQMTEAEKDNARHGRGIPKRFGGRAPDVAETGEPPLPTAPAPTPTPPLPVVAPATQLPTVHGAPEQKQPEPTGGPNALENAPSAKVYEPVPSQPVEGQQAMPVEEGGIRVPPPEEAGAKIPLEPAETSPAVPAEAPKAQPAAEPAPVQPVEAKPAETPIPPRTLPGAGINSKDVAKQYGLPEDFYGTGDEQGGVSSKYRTPEYDKALEAESRAAGLQGINATTIRRQARERTEAAFKDLVDKARKSMPEATPEPSKPGPKAPAQPAEAAAKAPWQMTREEFAATVRGKAEQTPGLPEAPPPLYESLLALENKLNRKGYNPDLVTEEKLAALGDESLIHGSAKRPRFTDEGRSKLSEWKRMAKERDMALGDISDKLVDEAMDQHKASVVQALSEGKPVSREVLDDYSDLRAKPPAEPPAEPSVGEGPGAKTAGAPKYPAIQQLTDQLNAAEKVGKKQRGTLEKIADTWARRGDITTKAIAKTRVAAVKAFHWWEGVRKATDIDRHLGEYDNAIQSSVDFSKQAKKAIERQMRDVTDREAAAILIDSARIAKDPGNPAEVRQIIKDGIDLLPADTPKSVRAAMERALDPSLELRQFSESLKQYFGIREQDAIGADLFEQGLTDYYTHVWEKESNMPSSLRNAVATGRVNTYFQFARQRTIPTLIEGILEGKKPVLDPAKVIPFYNFAMDRAIASRTFMKAVTDLKASDGRPAADVRGGARVVDPLDATSEPSVLVTPKTQAQAINDYRAINHPAMQKWKWLTKTPEGREVLMRGDLVVHPEFHEQLARFMDRDRLKTTKLMSAALALGSTAKGFKLGLLPSTFHMVHVGTHAAFHWTNPFRWAPIDFEAPATRFAIEKGHLKLAPSPQELSMLQEGTAATGLFRKIPYYGEWVGAFGDWMFHEYIPRLKLNTFENAMNRNLFGARSGLMSTGRALKAGRLTENDVAARVGDAVNNAFGELNHLFLNKLGRDPVMQRWLRLIFLAPDFGEARMRFFTKGMSRYGSEERLALATMFGTLYFGARLGNWLSHGNAEADDWRHAFEVKVQDSKGKGHWVGMRSVVGDVGHLIERPGQFVYVRLSPAYSRPTSDFLFGRDERTGRRLNFEEKAKRAAQAFQPIGLGGLTEPDRTIYESLGQSMGLANRRDMAVNDIGRKAHEWREKQGLMPIVEVIPTDEPSYLKLRTALNIGKTGDAKKILEGLLKTRSHKQVEKAMLTYLEHPYTGSKELETQWAASFTKQDANLYLQAQKEKMDTLMDFYKLLGATLKNP